MVSGLGRTKLACFSNSAIGSTVLTVVIMILSMHIIISKATKSLTTSGIDLDSRTVKKFTNSVKKPVKIFMKDKIWQ